MIEIIIVIIVLFMLYLYFELYNKYIVLNYMCNDYICHIFDTD